MSFLFQLRKWQVSFSYKLKKRIGLFVNLSQRLIENTDKYRYFFGHGNSEIIISLKISDQTITLLL